MVIGFALPLKKLQYQRGDILKRWMLDIHRARCEEHSGNVRRIYAMIAEPEIGIVFDLL
jgi:hypothetical protein